MRRLATIILIVVPVLLAAGFVADRIAHERAEEAVLAAVGEEADLTGAELSIEGFPFLTQVLADRLSEVRGTARSLTTDGMVLDDVRVAVRGVTAQAPHLAENVEINATVPVETLEAQLHDAAGSLADGLHVDVNGNALMLAVNLLGAELGIVLEPKVVDGAVVLEVQDVVVGDVTVLPEPVRNALSSAVSSLELTVPGLPAGLELTVVEVVDDGLRVRLEGQDVELG